MVGRNSTPLSLRILTSSCWSNASSVPVPPFAALIFLLRPPSQTLHGFRSSRLARYPSRPRRRASRSTRDANLKWDTKCHKTCPPLVKPAVKKAIPAGAIRRASASTALFGSPLKIRLTAKNGGSKMPAILFPFVVVCACVIFLEIIL